MKAALALRNPTGTPVYNACGSTTIAAASYLQLSSALGFNCSALLVSNTTAKDLILATGASGSEVVKAIVAAGSLGVLIPLEIKAGTRLAAKAEVADATTGSLTINFLG